MPLAQEKLHWTQPPPEHRYATRKGAKKILLCLKQCWAVSACLRSYREAKATASTSLTPPQKLDTAAMRFRRSMHNRPDLPAPPDQQLSSEGSQDG